jgi:hypothetical protein
MMSESARSIAIELAKRFSVGYNGEIYEEETPYQLKVKRYKLKAECGMVLVRGGPLDGQWMYEQDANVAGVEYIRPDDWLFSRGI